VRYLGETMSKGDNLAYKRINQTNAESDHDKSVFRIISSLEGIVPAIEHL
jgi:hypothetical protein